MNEFDSMYLPGGTGSGVGSGVAYTEGYRAFLERFMHEHNIGTVLDVGCGDWQFSRLINWGDRLYLGVEEVEALVARLNKEHPRRAFTTTMPASRYDLVICKDVMIHLPNAEVIALLGELRRHTHLLLVNDLAWTNEDVQRGHYRALDLNAPPFNLGAEIVYRFPRLNHETKVVHHLCTT